MNRPYSEATVELAAAAIAKACDDEDVFTSEVNTDAHWDLNREVYRDDARSALDALAAAGLLLPEGAETRLPDHLRGDGPCQDCGTPDNIVWTIESVFWNRVLGGEGARDDPGGLLCVPCFVKRADAAGFVCRWRLAPEWHWETRAERAVRLAVDDSKPTDQDRAEEEQG